MYLQNEDELLNIGNKFGVFKNARFDLVETKIPI